MLPLNVPSINIIAPLGSDSSLTEPETAPGAIVCEGVSVGTTVVTVNVGVTVGV